MDAMTIVRQDQRKIEGLLERVEQLGGNEDRHERDVFVGADRERIALGEAVDIETGFVQEREDDLVDDEHPV